MSIPFVCPIYLFSSTYLSINSTDNLFVHAVFIYWLRDTLSFVVCLSKNSLTVYDKNAIL